MTGLRQAMRGLLWLVTASWVGLSAGCVVPPPTPATHMDMPEMDMGNPEATPADAIAGATLHQGTWHRMVTAPVAYLQVTGTAQLAVHAHGTTVTIRLAHLPAHQSYMSHVHVDTCKVLGGAHFRFDPAGGDMPPNEIHLAFTSQADGTGFMTMENPHQAGPEARSIIIHQREDDRKLLCADLSPA